MSLIHSKRAEIADYNPRDMATRIRLLPKDRKDQVVTAAMEVAVYRGYLFMTRDDIAARAQCSAPLVSKYMGTMASIRKTVMKRAIKEGNLALIVQGLAAKDPLCAGLGDDVKKAAAALLIGG